MRELEIIGEAVKNLHSDLTSRYENVEWKKIAGTRDKITHGYFSIDLEILWDVIEDDLPILKKQIKEILDKEKA